MARQPLLARAPRGSPRAQGRPGAPRAIFVFALFSLRLEAFLAATLLAAACAVNPATGHRQAMLISEETEFRIGRKADEQVRKEYGVYLEKPELRAYVDSVGQRLVKQSARPGIAFHFEVVDSTVVNAFALPGGFVYVTRGILEHLNSEDELAAVMGHEIGHVAARHGAAQISKAYIAQAGLVALTVLGDPNSAAAVGNLADLAVSLALQGYSREYERQADELGLRYASATGYNPKGEVRVLEMLARLEKRQPSTVESFFQSHPRTSERIQAARSGVAELKDRESDVTRRAFRRDDYLSRLDGMAIGDWNGRAFLAGRKLFDKEHRFSMQAPEGFTARLGTGQSPASFEREKEKMRAGVSVEPLPRKLLPKELFEQFREKSRGLKLVSESEFPGSRIPLHQARFSGRDDKGKQVEIFKAFGEHEGFGITMTVIAPTDRVDPARRAFEEMAASLAPLGSSEAAAIEPPRLKVRRVERGQTWASLAAGEADRAGRLAAYNGFDPAEDPPAGQLVKIPPSLALDWGS